MDYRQMTAPCGIDCLNCPMYVARESDKVRSMIAKNMNLTFEDAVCNGCRNQKGMCSAHSLEEPFSVYKCIEKKGLDFCFECTDFPCDFLHPYADQASLRPHNTTVFNLCLMKKMGVDSWAKRKQKKSAIHTLKRNSSCAMKEIKLPLNKNMVNYLLWTIAAILPFSLIFI